MKVCARMHGYLEGLPPYQHPISTLEEMVAKLLAGFPAVTGRKRDFLVNILEPDYVSKVLEASRSQLHSGEDEDGSVPWETG